MPIPFDDLKEDNPPDAVAWLRLVEEADGRGIRAALFQTSAQGEPLAFCFTRIDRQDPSLRQWENGSANPEEYARSTIVKSLFQNATGSPLLALCIAEEIPRRAFTDAIRVGLPFCLINPDRALTSAEWVGAPPDTSTGAGQIHDAVMQLDNPLEPFDRTASALAEAFADRQIQAMTAVYGLTAVLTLYPLPARPESPAGSPLTRETATAPRQDSPDGLPLTLAERLWAALANPVKSGPFNYGRQSGHAPQPNDDLSLEWPGELMPFQRDGVQALLNNPRLLLADDMGLGKTLQAIAAIRIIRAQGNGDRQPCLIVAPASLLDQWRREIAKWAPELSAIIIRGSAANRSWQWQAERDITLVSYDTLRSDFDGTAQSPVGRKAWDVVVADEAQRIKNRNDTSEALKGLHRTRSWALTGTPIENHEEELASILEFVDHNENHTGAGNGAGMPRRYRPGVELLSRHRELQLRRKKGDVLEDLPPKQVSKLTINLKPRQRSSYDKAEEDGVIYLKNLGSEVTVRHVLELITRLKQICNADPKTGESSKLEDIRDRIEQLAAQGHKALVFSQYTNDTSGVAAAANYLQEFNPLTLTGDMPQEQRTAAVDRFKTSAEHKALILSLRAGGLGLNLQEASYVFHLDRWWNPALERQAEDRSHRIGQTVKVNVIKYSCVNTIEERIDNILERKQDLFDHLIDDVSLDLSAQLSREDLFGLFGLEPAR